MPSTPSRSRATDSDDETNSVGIAVMKQKLHEFRMSKIRECLEEERKKSWIYVGNSFKEPPLAPSKN